MSTLKQQIRAWKKYKREVNAYIEKWEDIEDGEESSTEDEGPGSNPNDPPPPPPPISDIEP